MRFPGYIYANVAVYYKGRQVNGNKIINDRPIRILKNGQYGVVYKRKVYPILGGDKIDISGEYFTKGSCKGYLRVGENKYRKGNFNSLFGLQKTIEKTGANLIKNVSVLSKKKKDSPKIHDVKDKESFFIQLSGKFKKLKLKK